MGNDKRTYTIVETGNGGPPKGTPVLGGKNGKPLPKDELLIFNKDKDDLKKTDFYKIRFEIKDFEDSALRFTPNRKDVLWVKKGEGPGSCPTTPCHDLMDDTILLGQMDPDGEWIEVINMDMRREEFWFTLNLVDKTNPTSTAYVPVDPGAGNQNGGEPPFTSASLTTGAITGSIVAIGAVALASNAFDMQDALLYGLGGGLVGLAMGFVIGRI